MGRKQRRKRKPKVADVADKKKLGAKQLPEARVRGEAPEVSDTDSQSDNTKRPDRRGGRGSPDTPQAEEGVGGAVPSVSSEQGEPAEERWGAWPYKVVLTPEDLLALGEWLQAMGREVDKTPVGLAANEEELAFATRERGWVLPEHLVSIPALSPQVRQVLKRTLTVERTAPALVVRSTAQTMDAMDTWLGENVRDSLTANIVHDMEVLEYTTGVPVARDMSPLKDALDCATVGPAMAITAPRFYREVGIPLVRQNARILEINTEEMSSWTLVYEWLLFKVLTHYTHDPTLTLWYKEDRSPMQEFASYLELDAKQALSFLLWMVCGEDERLLGTQFPDMVQYLPQAPQLTKALHIDRKLPNLQLGLTQLMGQCAIDRKVMTLYGRISPWGLRPEELLHFVIMGSVDDILDVAVASIIKMGSKEHWLIPEAESRYPRYLRGVLTGYTRAEPIEWQQKLEGIGVLGNPLGNISLEPKVTVS